MEKGVHIRNFSFDELMHFVRETDGNVFLKTAEGDILNLKSQLTSLLVLSGALGDSVIDEAVVVCDNAEDESRLFRMNLYRA